MVLRSGIPGPEPEAGSVRPHRHGGALRAGSPPDRRCSGSSPGGPGRAGPLPRGPGSGAVGRHGTGSPRLSLCPSVGLACAAGAGPGPSPSGRGLVSVGSAGGPARLFRHRVTGAAANARVLGMPASPRRSDAGGKPSGSRDPAPDHAHSGAGACHARQPCRRRARSGGRRRGGSGGRHRDLTASHQLQDGAVRFPATLRGVASFGATLPEWRKLMPSTALINLRPERACAWLFTTALRGRYEPCGRRGIAHRTSTGPSSGRKKQDHPYHVVVSQRGVTR